MFIDRLRDVKLIAGKGGDGKKHRSSLQKPDGGDGGNGGNIIIRGNSNYYDLSHLASKKIYQAANGENGGKNQKTGANGKDLILEVPLTTRIFDDASNLICTISEPYQQFTILEGGGGGRGNYYFRGHFMGYDKTTPGKEGGRGVFNFELELASDIIFIGLPNAGKSTILKEITNAEAKIGAYAFTTINPQQGRMDGITLLDLPGLIEETYMGKGVGTRFVKHTYSAEILAHIISMENEDIPQAYKSIRNEIKNIGEGLENKFEIIVLTKRDVASDEKIKSSIEFFSKLGRPVICITAIEKEDMNLLQSFFKKHYESLQRPR
jgi:GTP-binding protein